MIDLQDKTVLVTGGARGIGAAIARAVGAAGATVLLHYGRSEAAAEALREAIGADRCHLIQADLADPEAPAALWRSAREVAMRFNLVVNLERMTPDADMRDVARHLTEMVEMADEGGFDIVWAAEHHALEMTIAPGPFQLLAHLAVIF